MRRGTSCAAALHGGLVAYAGSLRHQLCTFIQSVVDPLPKGQSAWLRAGEQGLVLLAVLLLRRGRHLHFAR